MSGPQNQWQLVKNQPQLIDKRIAEFFGLPDEIRGMIVKMLNQPDALNLRMVCRRLRLDVENLFPFKVEFNQDNIVVPWLSGLRVRDCRLIIPTDASKSNLLRNLQLQHPKMIQSFTVIHPVDRSRRNNTRKRFLSVCPEIYMNLLRSCSETVRKLTLTFDFRVINHLFPAGLWFHFPNLSTIQTTVCAFEQLSSPEDLQITGDHFIAPGLFEQLLAQSSTPNLRSIEIDLRVSSVPDGVELLKSVVICLGKPNIPLFTKFSLIIPPTSFFWEWSRCLRLSEILPVNEIDNFNSIQKLENVHLEFVNLSDENSCWYQLLRNQRKLEYVNLKSFVLRYIPAALLYHIAVHNSETLVEIKVRHFRCLTMELGVTKPFDLSVFRNCCRLKILDLDNYIDSYIPGAGSLINIQLLPFELQELRLSYFHVNTAELITFAHTLPLKLIAIKYGGTHGDVGITGSVMNHMMTMPNLMHIEFKEFNLSDEAENNIVHGIIEKYDVPRRLQHKSLKIKLSRTIDRMDWE